jgi:two-component system, LytTR family, response regulator LytT
MSEESQEDDEIIHVSIEGRTIPILRSQIRWVEAERNFVRLHTRKQSYLWRGPLNRLEEQWSKHNFVRIHRARLVYLPLVTELRRGPSGYSVRIGSGPEAKDLKISRRHLKKFKQRWIKQPEF